MNDAAPIVNFRVNGKEVSVDACTRGHLADYLRHDRRQTGTHLGCEHGVCGACNVMVDGQVVRGCLTQVAQLQDAEVQTIEGLTAEGRLHALQEAFVARNALQCGFCTSGMLLTAVELLDQNPDPSRAEIRDAISGNLCRCTGYHAIVDAIEDVARGRTPEAPKAEGIGAPLPRAAARRPATGTGRYLDDITPAHCAHVAFLRSPHAHARILSIDTAEALAMPGVLACFTGEDLARVSPPWVTSLAGVKGHSSPPQPCLALGETCWQGEAVVAVVAESRAEAEDAAELVMVEFEELPAVTDTEAALSDVATVHAAQATNLILDQVFTVGDAEAAFAGAAVIAEQDFAFTRQTGMSLEPRGIIAEFDPARGEIRVHLSHQAPFQQREIYAEQLGLDPGAVQVIVPDVGGAFGLKLHAYADEMAVVAIATLMDRPVKWVADRLESFTADAHAREASGHARIAVDAEGRVLGFEVDLLAGFGAYSMYPRGSVGEALQACSMVGGPYAFGAFKGRLRGVLQNKAPTGAYRGVGQPIATAITEQLMDLAADALGISPEEIRWRNYIAEPGETTSPLGLRFEPLSLRECQDRLEGLAGLAAKRAEHARLRAEGIHRGLGLAAFVEMTGVGSRLYGPLGVAVAAQESARVTLEARGRVKIETSVTDQGQGTLSALAQIAAAELGVSVGQISLGTIDTARNPYGGGAWASRGVALGGEAVLRASRGLKASILAIAGALTQRPAEALRIVGEDVTDASGSPLIALDRVLRLARYNPTEIPLSVVPSLSVEESFLPGALPYLMSNGVVAVEVELDPDTGLVDVLGAWVVDDCGRVVNPLLVDEQLRGGLAQGIGAALYEECVYSADGQLETGTLADYLVPMAAEMPDIAIAHVSTPSRATLLGAKGVGEAGLVAGPAALRCAINDALRPLGAQVTHQPYSPARILAAQGIV